MVRVEEGGEGEEEAEGEEEEGEVAGRRGGLLLHLSILMTQSR